MRSWLRRWVSGPPRALIVVGIDYATHQLIQAAQQDRRLRVVAAIDDYPWNHRTRILGVPVHYPSEIAALAARTGARDVVIFNAAARLVDEPLRQALTQQRVRLHEVAETTASLALIEQLRQAG